MCNFVVSLHRLSYAYLIIISKMPLILSVSTPTRHITISGDSIIIFTVTAAAILFLGHPGVTFHDKT